MNWRLETFTSSEIVQVSDIFLLPGDDKIYSFGRRYGVKGTEES